MAGAMTSQNSAETIDMKKRIEWIDVAKYICILFVMIEHMECRFDEMSVFHTTCTLELFFFLAGYTHKAGRDPKNFFTRKVKTLLVPWFVFTFIDIILSEILTFNQTRGFLTEMKWNLLQIRGLDARMWFVAALFMAFVPFYFFIEWFNRKPDTRKRRVQFILLAFGLFLASVVYSHIMTDHPFSWGTCSLPWYLDYMFVAMFPMVLGYFFPKHWEQSFDKVNTRVFRAAIMLVYLAVIYYPYLTSFRLPETISEICARFINPYIGLTAYISFFKVIRSNRFFLYAGQNTILYFAMHGKFITLCQVLLKRFAGGAYAAILASKPLSLIFAITFAVFTSVMLLVPIYIINEYLPFLVGRPRRVKEK